MLAMSRDELCTLALLSSFAIWVTAHVLLAAKLARTPPRWRSPVAFVVLPLAPYWGARVGARFLAALWCLALVTWVFARALLAK